MNGRVIVSVVAQPDQRHAWPTADAEWWTDLRERIRAQIMEYHDTMTVLPADCRLRARSPIYAALS